MWEYMDPLKVEERKRGVGRRQMPVAARRAFWLIAVIYGSRHRRVYFCPPVSLETKTVCGERQSVRYYVSYLQLFCLEGRQSMFIFGRCLCNVGGVRKSSAATTVWAITLLTLIVALQRMLFFTLLGFILSERCGLYLNAQTASLLFSSSYISASHCLCFVHLSKLFFLCHFLCLCLSTSLFSITPAHRDTWGSGYGYVHWSSISANVPHLLFTVVDPGKWLCWAKVELQTQCTTVCGRWRAHR